MRLVESTPELYAHAMAIEREAAARYAELAERMEDEGREELAHVFGLLATMEAEHLEILERRARGIALPEIAPERYKWLESGAPEAFFEHVYWTTGDPALRALAKEMAEEGCEHVALVGQLFDETPQPKLDDMLIFAK